MKVETGSDTPVSQSLGWLATLIMFLSGIATADLADREGKFISGGPPIYPKYCVEKRYQGHVDLQFVIDVDGLTRDPVILDVVIYQRDPGKPIRDDEAEKWFIWAARKALEEFRYEAPIVNGELVEVPGVKTRISFALE